MTQRPLTIMLAFLCMGFVAGIFLWKRDAGEDSQPGPLRSDTSQKFAVIGAHDANGQPSLPQSSPQTASAAKATLEFQAMQRGDAVLKPALVPVPDRKSDESASDFTGIGIELVRVRSLPSLPATSAEVERAEVEQGITRWLSTQYAADHGRRFGRALAALGVIPQAVDTVALKAGFLSYQIGGWFDKEQDILQIANAPDGAIQKENALGLAYGNLFRSFGEVLFSESKRQTTDERLARESLMAGDAALTRVLHSVANPKEGGGGGVGEDPDDPSHAVPIPYFLREMELLPFSAGLNFVKALHSLGGFDQLDAAYHRPPLSCIEVWDAQSYLSDTPLVPPPITWKDVSITSKSPTWDDRLGVLCVVLYLKQHVTDNIAGEAAAGWVNDRFLAFAAEGKSRDHAVWQTRWKDSLSADRYFEAMKKHLASRYRETPMELNPAGVLQMKTNERSIALKRTHQGTGVLFVDAADAAFSSAAIQKFGNTNQ
jgi:hypothetical protein